MASGVSPTPTSVPAWGQRVVVNAANTGSVGARRDGASSSEAPLVSASSSWFSPYASFMTILTWPWFHKLFVAICILQATVDTLARIVILSVNSGAWSGYNDPSLTDDARQVLRQNLFGSVWFFGIIIVTTWSVAHYGIHAVYAVNAFELFTFFGAQLLLAARLIADYASKDDDCAGGSGNLCISFLAVSLCFCAAGVVLCAFMYKDLLWKRYKAIGADTGTRKLYRKWELFIAVKKLDLQFSFITLFTGLVYFSPLNTPTLKISMGINIFLFAVELAWEFFGSRGIEQEEPVYVYAFWACSSLLPVFLINLAIDNEVGSGDLLSNATSSVRLAVYVFCALCILNRIITVVCSVLLYRSFGPDYVGLKVIIAGKPQFNRLRVKVRERSVGVEINPFSSSGSNKAVEAAPSAATAGAGGGGAAATAAVKVMANPFAAALTKGGAVGTADDTTAAAAAAKDGSTGGVGDFAAGIGGPAAEDGKTRTQSYMDAIGGYIRSVSMAEGRGSRGASFAAAADSALGEEPPADDEYLSPWAEEGSGGAEQEYVDEGVDR